jgi:hypothetical protein
MHAFPTYTENTLHIVKDVVVIFREAFSIHPSIQSSIHGWHHIGKKTLVEINNPSPPPFAYLLLFRKSMSGPRVLIVKRLGQRVIKAEIITRNNVNKRVFIFLFEWHLWWQSTRIKVRHWTMLEYICRFRSFPMVSYMLLSHGSQAVQTSRFSAARVLMDTCEMWYIEKFWKCSL